MKDKININGKNYDVSTIRNSIEYAIMQCGYVPAADCRAENVMDLLLNLEQYASQNTEPKQ